MLLVFGSLNIDLVMMVPSLPRPGETVLCPGYALKPGGKGANQAVAAARAGASVVMHGALGPDGFAEILRAALAGAGVGQAGIRRAEAPTGCAAIAVDAAGENCIAVASGANLEASAALVPDGVLGPGTTVLMQMEVPAAETWALAARARARGARVVVNLAPAAAVPAGTLAAVDVLVVNEGEARMVAAGLGMGAEAGPAVLVPALARAAGLTVVATLGGAGAMAAEAEGVVWRVGALPIVPVDTTGAGDAFCGILAAGLDEGARLAEALHRAAVGAGLACLGLGAQESLPSAAMITARMGDLAAPQRLA